MKTKYNLILIGILLPLLLISYQNCGPGFVSIEGASEQALSSPVDETKPPVPTEPEEPKPEEPKPEEPKPEEPKTEEPKPEEPQSESYKVAKKNFDAALAGHKSYKYITGGCKNPTNNALHSVVTGYFNFEAYDGLIRAFKLTGNTEYLNAMVIMTNNHIDSGKNMFSPNGFLDWYSCNRNAYNDYHYEWRAAAGIGMFLTLLLDQPKLAISTAAYRSKLGDFLRNHVWSKWQGQGEPLRNDVSWTGGGTHMLARLIPMVIALEQYEGGTAAATPGKSYSNWLQNVVPKALEDHIMHPKNLNADGVSGNLWGRVSPAPGSDAGGSESPGTNDVGHAQDIYVTMLYAAKRGILRNPEGVRSRLAGAVNNIVWNGKEFNDWINGKASKNSKCPEGLFGIMEYAPKNRDAFFEWSKKNVNVSAVSYPSRMQVWAYFMSAYAEK